MNKNIMRRSLIYVVGVFFMSLGISFSIYADLGVSPVSSLSYAVTLVTGISVGTITVFTHFFYIGVQVLITRVLDIKDAAIQLAIAFLFGFFIDASLFLVQLVLPAPTNLAIQWLYLIISLFLIAMGLTGYTNVNFTLMPYDELTNVISKHFNMTYGHARIVGDVSNVLLALAIGFIFLGSLGSIGIGTVVAAVSVGRILNWLMKLIKKYNLPLI